MEKFIRRFWSKIEKNGPVPSWKPELGKCWIWTGGKNNGYGQFKPRGRGDKLTQAHRFSYEIFNGKIPEGLDIDHLCRNRACSNPTHLEAVTRKVNIQRAALAGLFGRRNREKTHCDSGHEFNEKNTYVYKGLNKSHRACRACGNERQRAKNKTHYKQRGEE